MAGQGEATDANETENKGGAKGSPDLKAENTRLKGELEQANARLADLEKQQQALQTSLDKTMSEDDVKAAVEKGFGVVTF